MKIKCSIVTLILATIACQTTPAATPAAQVDISQVIAQTASVALTLTARANPPGQSSNTESATATPVPATAASGNHYAWNNVGSQDSGGITIQIARVVLADKTSIPEIDFSPIEAFNDKPIVVEIIFKVTNSTDKTVSVYPDQGTVVVGGEQIELVNYMMLATFGESVGGEIFPGVTKIGGIWFGIKRTSIEEVQQMIISFMGPHDADFNSLGPDFNFTIDLSNRQDQPLPDELK